MAKELYVLVLGRAWLTCTWIKLDIRGKKILILLKSGDALAWVAQWAGGITIPGGVSTQWRCGTVGCGQWAMLMVGGQLD